VMNGMLIFFQIASLEFVLRVNDGGGVLEVVSRFGRVGSRASKSHC